MSACCDPDLLPDHWARLTFSRAGPNHHQVFREHTTVLGMSPLRPLHPQWLRQLSVWWIISDGSGLHCSFGACEARGPSWRGVAGRVHGPANSFLAELWGLVHALRLVPRDAEAIFLVNCQGALFRAADGLPLHAAQRLRLACGEALSALQLELGRDLTRQPPSVGTPGTWTRTGPVASLPPLS